MNTSFPQLRLSQGINAESQALLPATSAFLLFFCLFTSYFMLRPIRESMGITAGVENFQWLSTATLFVMLAAVPMLAWLSSRVTRLHFVDWVYGFISVNLMILATLSQVQSESPWMARVFYVWRAAVQDAPAPLRWTVRASYHRQTFQRLDASPEVALPTGYIQLCGAARNFHDISLL
jgi:AAA family ATP:ADP antiporter